MGSNNKYGRKTLKDLREEAQLSKSAVYKYVGVTPKSYDAWEEGDSIPSLVRAVRLAELFNKPMTVICEAFGIDVSKVPSDGSLPGIDVDSAPSVSEPRGDYEVVAEIFSNRPPEEIAALLRVFLKGNDGGLPPSSATS